MDFRNRVKPLKAINRVFEGKESWQVASITAASVVAVFWIHELLNGRESLMQRTRKEFFRWLRKLPMVQRQIESKIGDIKRGFQEDAAKRLMNVKLRPRLPEKGLSSEEVIAEVKELMALGKFNISNGCVSGAVYHDSDEITDVACQAYSLTAYTNPLHADVFPGINKMEAEIIRIAVNLFNGDDECCGTVTTGGTESILMACKAFRDRAYSLGITNPQIIVPSTVHSAFDKAAQYLGLSVKTIPVDKSTLKVDVGAVEKAIGRRTCLIVGSAPNFPYGTMDDIEALSKLAVKYNVPLHVDSCLGGWLTAFMSEAGFHLPMADFRLPGVASISADTHKYGFTPKGTSVVLYRKPEYRHFQYTVTTEWPGGVYGSPTVNGSRAGGCVAACWATLMFIGREKYVKMTKDIITTARYIESKLREIDGIYIFGKPATSVVAIGSKVFDVFRLADSLHAKGWSLNALQFPSGIHICVTAVHTKDGIADRFIADVRSVVGDLMRDPGKPVEGKMAIYGVAQSIPDRSLIGDIARHFIDSTYYLPKEEDVQKIRENGEIHQ